MIMARLPYISWKFKYDMFYFIVFFCLFYYSYFNFIISILIKINMILLIIIEVYQKVFVIEAKNKYPIYFG